ncbi:hypothetical protein BAL199_06791, partial [alpha proteobacterium BAL199]
APQKAGRDEGMVSPVEQRDRCRPVVRPQLDSRYPLGFQKRLKTTSANSFVDRFTDIGRPSTLFELFCSALYVPTGGPRFAGEYIVVGALLSEQSGLCRPRHRQESRKPDSIAA